MSEDLDPDALRARTFSTTRRGFDRTEVEAFQQEVADHLIALQRRIDEMDERLGQVGITELPDLKHEFDTVAEDVREILQSARDAAADMRNRASTDAARWRDDVAAEVAGTREEAEGQSELLRRSAWEASESMLTQVTEQVEEMTARAHEDVLFVRAEAEREALRLTGDAKRDAEEMLRSARADSEKVALDARNEAERTILSAQQSEEAAAERVRTLEHRHQELLDELGATRQTLADLEDHIAGRRSALTHATTDPTETSVRVLSDEDDDSTDRDADNWLDEDATVRLLPPPLPAAMEPVDADELAAEVESLRSLSPPIIPIEPPRHGLELVTGGSESSAEAASLDFEITSGDVPATADAAATAELSMIMGRPPEPEEPRADVEPEPPPEPESEPQPEPQVESGPESEPDTGPEAAADPEPESEPESDTGPEAAADPEPESEPESDTGPGPDAEAAGPPGDDIDSLFASLRAPQPEPADPPATESEPQLEAAMEPEPAAELDAQPDTEPAPPPVPAADPEPVPDTGAPPPDVVDRAELRDRLVMPVTNEALRAIKRAIVDAQNAVLEDLRTGPDDWRPKRSMFDAVVGPEAAAVASRAYLAGVSAAGELVAAPAPEIPDQSSLDLSSVVTDLWEAAVNAVEACAGGGNRERGASVGRVFRAWRTDEAERRVRAVAHSEYNAGVAAGLDALGIGYSIEPAGRGLADPDTVVIPKH